MVSSWNLTSQSERLVVSVSSWSLTPGHPHTVASGRQRERLVVSVSSWSLTPGHPHTVASGRQRERLNHPAPLKQPRKPTAGLTDSVTTIRVARTAGCVTVDHPLPPPPGPSTNRPPFRLRLKRTQGREKPVNGGGGGGGYLGAWEVDSRLLSHQNVAEH